VSAFLGASPQELESLAQAFTGFSEILDARRREINTRLHTAGWEGERADSFRAEWDSKHNPTLTILVGMLTSAVATLRYEAQQQDWASAATSAGHMPTPLLAASAPLSDNVHPVHNSLLDDGIGLFRSDLHTAESVVHQDVADLNHFQHAIVSTPVFQEAVSDARMASCVLSTAAPFVALVPGVGDAVAAGMVVTAVTLSAGATLGDVAEMANGVRPWSIAQLGGDALNTAFSAAGAAGLAKDTEMGSNLIQAVAPDASAETAARVSLAFNLGAQGVYQGAGEVGTVQHLAIDIHDGNYASVGSDTVQMASPILGDTEP